MRGVRVQVSARERLLRPETRIRHRGFGRIRPWAEPQTKNPERPTLELRVSDFE
jgi:hypothetical protein